MLTLESLAPVGLALFLQEALRPQDWRPGHYPYYYLYMNEMSVYERVEYTDDNACYRGRTIIVRTYNVDIITLRGALWTNAE